MKESTFSEPACRLPAAPQAVVLLTLIVAGDEALRAGGVEGQRATVELAVVGAGPLALLLRQHTADGVVQVNRVGALCFAVRAPVVHCTEEKDTSINGNISCFIHSMRGT
ncbi:hypothetical protein E2C01_028986 [Portunus trituberculatus]|uniref:Uncharacterized protein n=1 Tax=Portunus trituberculatus TaxID=210409 RepID=A0A5B7EM57_PORTR|nr:hypothetical protein [Portunus trituberculatus]